MSSDGVTGVDGVVCLAVHSQKKAAQHTALFACDGVHQCVVLCGGWWVSVSVCCGVVGAGEKKKGRGKDTVKQKQKGLFPKPLFPFSLFSSSFSSTLFSLPSTLPPSLPSYPNTHMFSCFAHECIHCEPKTPMTQHLILFIVFSSCPNSLFLFFSFCG